jgi:hypothetical protein
MLCGLDHGQYVDFNKRECTHSSMAEPQTHPPILRYRTMLEFARRLSLVGEKMIIIAVYGSGRAEGGILPKDSLLANLIIIQKNLQAWSR